MHEICMRCLGRIFAGVVYMACGDLRYGNDGTYYSSCRLFRIHKLSTVLAQKLYWL